MTQVQLREGEWRRAEGDVTRPELFQRYLAAHDLFNERLRAVAREEGALLIDLAAAGDWTAAELYDGLHFSDAGSERAAALIAAALAQAEGQGGPGVAGRSP
jgi:lysophospholipase L1-like esterase